MNPSNFSVSRGSSENMVKTASTTNIIYQEDFANDQGFWNLHDVPNPSFIIHSSKVENYISNVEDTYFPWIYTNTSFNLDSQDIYPADIFFHDGFWWMCGVENARVYKYDEDWIYTGENIYLGNEDNSPYSIYFHNGFWWMCGDDNDLVYKYFSNWTYTGESHNIHYYHNQYPLLRDICFHGGYWWVCAAFEQIIIKYDENWTYTGERYDIGSWTTFITDIRFFDGFWWVCDLYHDEIFRYSEDWIYTEESYDIGSEDDVGHSIEFHEGYWWMCGEDHDRIYKYYFQKELSKFAYKDGYSYMQTNITEILTLRSSNNLNLTVLNNTYIDIEFTLNSPINITFSLLDSGLVKKLFTFSSLENFSHRKVTFNVSDAIFINQLEFSGFFNNTNSLILDSITIYNIYNEEKNQEVISFGSFYIYFVLILLSLIVFTTLKRKKLVIA